jgi:hypothetical protein
VGCRAFIFALALVAVPLAALADELDGSPRKTLFLILLSSGKGDEAAFRQLKSAVSSSGRVIITESAGGADLIGKLEIARTRDSQALTATVLNRGGEILIRSVQRVRAGANPTGAIDALAWDIAAAVANDRPPERVPERALRIDMPPSNRAPELEERDEEAPELEAPRLTFVAGVELGVGPWFADSSDIVRGSTTGFDFSRYGPAFTEGLDGRLKGTLNLHGGWRFFQAAGVEAAVQSSAWGNDGRGAGGAILVGGRFIGFPLQAFYRERKFELGLEVGGGYAFLGGPYYDMSGKYLSLGISGEYPIKPWLSFQVNYRMFMSFLNKFYVDYANDVTEPVKDFTAYWHTLTAGVVFRIHSRL